MWACHQRICYHDGQDIGARIAGYGSGAMRLLLTCRDIGKQRSTVFLEEKQSGWPVNDNISP